MGGSGDEGGYREVSFLIRAFLILDFALIMKKLNIYSERFA